MRASARRGGRGAGRREVTPMSEFYEQTPSQAEGERDDDDAVTDARASRTGPARSAYDPPRTTPSQAEGERTDDTRDTPGT